MSELRQSPWYTEDFLYVIAEKLLAKVPDGRQITFCEQNPYTWFMGHNQMATRVVIAQFAKFKRIDFCNYPEKRIEFYKNADKSARINESQTEDFSFGGPCIVPPGMLEYIIEKGKLRINTIETRNFLPDDHSTDIKELGEMNSLKAFCALFLGKQIQIPDGLNNNIEVKKFTVYEPVESIKNNFEAILAIDAVELEINFCPNIIINCSQYNSPIIANNTTKITANCSFDRHSNENHGKIATNFESFCSFLVRACPNLNNLHIIIIAFYSKSTAEFTDNLYTTIKAMEAGIKSINTDNEHLQISIELSARFPPDIYNELPFGNHDLFKLGSPSAVEPGGVPDNYIERNLECVDVRGRIHKLEFIIISGLQAYQKSVDGSHYYIYC